MPHAVQAPPDDQYWQLAPQQQQQQQAGKGSGQTQDWLQQEAGSQQQQTPAWRQQQQDVQQQAEAARQRYNLAMQGMQQQQLTPEGTKVGEGRKRPCLVGRLHNLKPGLAYPVQLLRASRPAQRH